VSAKAEHTKPVVIHGDALDLGKHVPAASATLAYLDPPFNVGTSFRARRDTAVAYEDKWPSIDAYIEWLAPRVAAVRELLSDEASLWLHLDQRTVHEAKVLCDRVFGRAHFTGEIIWVPGNGSKSRRGPGMSHQTILVYARGKACVWNSKDPALRAPFASTSLAMHFGNKDDEGRAYRERTINKKTYRYYADEGRALGSVWTDCPAMVANTPLRSESTGYPTQKPVKLLDRIVRAASRPRDLVIDPFCGSGTTLEVATRLGRRAIGSDIGALAVATSRARLAAVASAVPAERA
jgi:site-specific DNA-methyltransferase (adenine-specific)